MNERDDTSIIDSVGWVFPVKPKCTGEFCEVITSRLDDVGMVYGWFFICFFTAVSVSVLSYREMSRV